MNINELKNKRAELVSKMREQLDNAEKETRALSVEEKTSYDAMEKDLDSINDTITKEERLYKFETENPVKSEPVKSESVEARSNRLFTDYLKNGSAEYRALANDTDSAGGYLHASEQFMNTVIKALDNYTYVKQFATVLPVTTSDEIGIPTLTTDVAAPTWTTEVASISEDSSAAFGRRTLKPNQLSKLVKVSEKLLKTSAIPVDTFVGERLAYQFAITLENAFLNGSGSSNQPLGIFTASNSGISTGRDITDDNTVTGITTNGLLNAKYAVKAQYRNGARWIFHRDLVKMIAKLKDSDGAYLWQPSVIAGQPDMLLGLPIDESEYAPNTVAASKYVGALCNWKYYYIAEMMNLSVLRLNELYAATSQVGFIGKGYWDGAPVLEEAFSRVATPAS